VTGPGTRRDAAGEAPADRAARLLLWYPRAWRARYGEEFTELLISDIAERPRSTARTLDVARGGLVARLTDAGLAGLAGLPLAGSPGTASSPSTPSADPYRLVRASIGTLGAAFAVCLAFSAAMWSQLTIAWQWTSPPDATPPAMRATLVMSAALLAFLAIGALAVLPVGHAVARNFHRKLIGPLLALAVAVAFLVVGGHHFGNGWPGTGGHGENGSLFPVIPAGLQAFAWALSLSVSSFWAHPTALAKIPGAEVAWMELSPLALTAATAAAVTLTRRVKLSPRTLRYETGLAWLSCAAMGIFLVSCGYWVCVGRQPGLMHAGLIDIAGTAVVALALAVALQARRMAMRGLRLARS